MKKIYMVKKNPNMPESEDNWIMMNGYDFAMFIKTEEGQRRKNNFAQIDACGEDDDIYIVECGEERAKKWRAEKDAHDYLKECEVNSGFETISFNAVDADGEELNLEDVVADPDSDVESEAFRRMKKEKIRSIVNLLSEDEYNLIFELFLSDEPMSLSEIADRENVAVSTIMRRRDKILEKIKNYF